MQDMNSGQLGRWLIVAGLVMAAVGGVMLGLSKLGLFRLPGDLQFGGKHWRVYVPIASCIVISVILTVILWLIGIFRK